MGFFKDMRAAKTLSKEISRDWDPGVQLRDSVGRLHQTTQMLNAQAAIANDAETIIAKATIIQVAATGTYLNLDPVIAISLLVDLPGQPPVPTSLRSPVPVTHLAKVQPGQPLSVRINPATPQQVSPQWW